MHPLRCLALACLLALCSTAALAAAPQKNPVSALILSMQERYAQVRSFKAEFVQKLTHQESGAVETRTGILWFQLPLRMRWETQRPDPELLVVTEKEIWNYLPSDNIAYRYAPALARDSRSIIQVITGQSRLDEDFTVTEAGREGNLVILNLYPKEPTIQFTEGRLWVSQESKLINRAVVTDFYGNANDITLNAMSLNLTPPNATFAFTPPAGTTVEDRTDADTAGTPLLQ